MKQNYEKVPGDEPADDATPVTENNAEIKATPQSAMSDPAKPPQGETSTWRLPAVAEYNQQRDRHHDIAAPDSMAPVTLVRAYIVAVLHTFYDVPRDEADSTAAKWQGKLGRQFLAIESRDEFEKEFGEKHGAMLWDYCTTRTARQRKDFRVVLTCILGFIGGIALFIKLVMIVNGI